MARKEDEESTGTHAAPPPFDPKQHCIRVKGGKLYLPVAERIRWATADREEGGYEISIESEVVHVDGDMAVVKSVVTIPGRGVATGIKSETRVGFPNYIEKAATGSIGRALALLGYGTDYALELWEEDVQEGGDVSRAVDTPREAPAARTQTAAAAGTARTQSTAAGGVTGATAKAAAPTPAERLAKANAEIKRLAREHGYQEPASYGALVRLAREQYDWNLPAVKHGEPPKAEALEALVAHMIKLGGDPAKEDEPATGGKTAATDSTATAPVPDLPFEGAALAESTSTGVVRPGVPEDPAQREVRYQRGVAAFLQGLEQYSAAAELDNILHTAEQLGREGNLRADDLARIRARHRERVGGAPAAPAARR